jgi:phosphatidylglycerophosphate synthase
MKNLALEVYLKGKEWRDKVLDRPSKWFLSIGVSANQMSFFRAFLAVPMFFCVGRLVWVAVVLLFANEILDAFDGVMARISKKESLKGRVLDVCIDNFYVVPLVLALIFFNMANGFWATVYILNVVVDYFLNYLRFGIEVGKYPFSFSKYFVYLALFLFALGLGNFFDPILLFWSVVLVVLNVFALKEVYQNAK